MKANCFKCNQELNYLANSTVGRSDSCNKCYSSVRVCKNCSFYDTNKHNECSEPQSERIVDKEKANFCDFFKLKFSIKPSIDSSPILNSKEKALSDLEQLFKK